MWCSMPSNTVSSWKSPWEFKRSNPFFLGPEAGLHAYYCFDPYVERLLLNKIPKDQFEGNVLHRIHSSEITRDWLESKLLTLDLFATNDSYLVIQADGLSSDAKEWLLENEVPKDLYFILSFGKNAKFVTELSKKQAGHYFSIQAPPFWKMSDYLQFLCDELAVPLSYQALNWLLESVPNETADFVNALKLIKLNFSSPANTSIEEISRVILAARFDSFKLASLYARKEKQAFYRELLAGELVPTELIKFFGFMQGHLFKMLDTSYLNYMKKGKRPSPYDKEILVHTKKWTGEELKKSMRHFSQLQILAKGNKDQLADELRLAYFNCF